MDESASSRDTGSTSSPTPLTPDATKPRADTPDSDPAEPPSPGLQAPEKSLLTVQAVTSAPLKAKKRTAKKRPAKKRPAKKRLSAADHYAHAAYELLASAQLQQMAETAGSAQEKSSTEQFAAIESGLADKGLSLDALNTTRRSQTYRDNLAQALPVFFQGIARTFPDATFSFTPIGTEGRVAQLKGDVLLDVFHAGANDREVRLISLKNYESGPRRIQVCSGTFQSFALRFFLEPVAIGKWKSPIDGSTCHASQTTFRQWRDAALRHAAGDNADAVVAGVAKLDALSTEMRTKFLVGEEFRYYQKDAVRAEQCRVGTEGAKALAALIGLADPALVKSIMLKATGLDGAEDLLVFGGGLIADTVTDPNFATFITKLRQSSLKVSQASQCINFQFVDGTDIVLAIQVPCTINTNGAWFRDDEPYEGTRYHAKEDVELAWGERRPDKSREIATSINTYLNLKATGLLRELPELVTADPALDAALDAVIDAVVEVELAALLTDAAVVA